MSGYRVVLGALRDASEGVDGLLLNVRSEPLRAGSHGTDALADARLVAAVDRFLDRWGVGVDLLVRDAEAVATQLDDATSEHWIPGTDHEMDERGLAIDLAMGAFINAFIHVNDRERGRD